MDNSHDFVSCMLYWILLDVCERSNLCCIVYFAFQTYFFFFFFWYLNNLVARNQLYFWKTHENIYIFFSFTQLDSIKPIQLLKTYWSIHTSRCIVVLSVLLLIIFMYKFDTLIHIFSFVFKRCIGFMLSKCVNGKMCICFHMFFKNSFGFGLSNCLNAKIIHLEYEIYNAA